MISLTTVSSSSRRRRANACFGRSAAHDGCAVMANAAGLTATVLTRDTPPNKASFKQDDQRDRDCWFGGRRFGNPQREVTARFRADARDGYALSLVLRRRRRPIAGALPDLGLGQVSEHRRHRAGDYGAGIRLGILCVLHGVQPQDDDRAAGDTGYRHDDRVHVGRVDLVARDLQHRSVHRVEHGQGRRHREDHAERVPADLCRG